MKILLISFLFITVNCEPKHLEKRVVGGEPCSTTTHKFIVSLVRKEQPYNFCGGSLIKLNWVLTSAQCLTPYLSKPSNIKVSAGISLKQPLGSQSEKAKKIIVPENSTSYDVGLILLRKPFVKNEETDVIETIQKKIKGDVLTFCDKGTALGWGVQEKDVRKKSKQPAAVTGFTGDLQCVEIPVISQRECNYSRQLLTPIPPASFCAFYINGTKDTCEGDIGGPFVCNNVLVGVVSYGMCATPKMPSLYARVDEHLEFIQNTLEKTIDEDIGDDDTQEEDTLEDISTVDNSILGQSTDIITEKVIKEEKEKEEGEKEEKEQVEETIDEIPPMEEEKPKEKEEQKQPKAERGHGNNILPSIMLFLYVAMCYLLEL